MSEKFKITSYLGDRELYRIMFKIAVPVSLQSLITVGINLMDTIIHEMERKRKYYFIVFFRPGKSTGRIRKREPEKKKLIVTLILTREVGSGIIGG